MCKNENLHDQIYTMKFCPECKSVMAKTTTSTGEIVFLCHCQVTVKGNNDDTLMASGGGTGQSDLKHAVMIDNSPFDLAGNKIKRDCPLCGVDFLTLVRVGANEITMYTCSCGYRATYDESRT